jgi:hypothetical protein
MVKHYMNHSVENLYILKHQLLNAEMNLCRSNEECLIHPLRIIEIKNQMNYNKYFLFQKW